MNTDVMFSSKTDNWATPQDFFDELNREFGFTLVQIMPITSALLTIQKNKTVSFMIGVGNEYFVTLPMEKRLASGFRNLLRRVANQIPLS